LGDTGPKVTDFLDRVPQLAYPAFGYCLVRGQGRLQAVRIISEHPPYLGDAESERTQGYDLSGSGDLIGTIGPPSGRSAARGYEAALLIEP
jgi:hypothetical protein